MKRINSLQALRAFAFCVVLVSHCDFPRLQGALGVSIFFVLSGFCMAINYIPRADALPSSFKGCVLFGWNRIKKLYILHVLMVFFKVFVLWGMPHTAQDYVSLVLNLLLLQSFVPDPAVYGGYNGIAWFLSTYMFVSMAAPLVLRFASGICTKKRLGISFAATVGIMLIFSAISPYIISAMALPSRPFLNYNFPPYRLLDFSLGIFLGRLYLMRDASSDGLGVISSALVALGVVLCGVAATLLYPRLPESIRNTLIYAPGSLLAVYLCAFSNERVQALLSWRPAVWLGDLSGHAFLIHNNAIIIVRYFLNMLEYKYGYTRSAPETVAWICASFILTIIATELYLVIARRVRGLIQSRASAGT